jgi:hypothetical protein
MCVRWIGNSKLYATFKVSHDYWYTTTIKLSFENHSLCAQVLELEVEWGLILKKIVRAFVWYKIQDLRLHIVSPITKIS